MDANHVDQMDSTVRLVPIHTTIAHLTEQLAAFVLCNAPAVHHLGLVLAVDALQAMI